MITLSQDPVLQDVFVFLHGRDMLAPNFDTDRITLVAIGVLSSGLSLLALSSILRYRRTLGDIVACSTLGTVGYYALFCAAVMQEPVVASEIVSSRKYAEDWLKQNDQSQADSWHDLQPEVAGRFIDGLVEQNRGLSRLLYCGILAHGPTKPKLFQEVLSFASHHMTFGSLLRFMHVMKKTYKTFCCWHRHVELVGTGVPYTTNIELPVGAKWQTEWFDQYKAHAIKALTSGITVEDRRFVQDDLLWVKERVIPTYDCVKMVMDPHAFEQLRTNYKAHAKQFRIYLLALLYQDVLKWQKNENYDQETLKQCLPPGVDLFVKEVESALKDKDATCDKEYAQNTTTQLSQFVKQVKSERKRYLHSREYTHAFHIRKAVVEENATLVSKPHPDEEACRKTFEAWRAQFTQYLGDYRLEFTKASYDDLGMLYEYIRSEGEFPQNLNVLKSWVDSNCDEILKNLNSREFTAIHREYIQKVKLWHVQEAKSQTDIAEKSAKINSTPPRGRRRRIKRNTQKWTSHNNPPSTRQKQDRTAESKTRLKNTRQMAGVFLCVYCSLQSI